MGVLQRFRAKVDNGKRNAEYEEAKQLETAKVRAFRAADEMVEASNKLMRMALELRDEIEAMDSD